MSCLVPVLLFVMFLQTSLESGLTNDNYSPQLSFQQAIGKFQVYGNKTYRDLVLRQLHSNFRRLLQTDWKTFLETYTALANFNHQCFDDVSSIISSIIHRNLSGLQWLDASGHLPSGITGGAVHWIGSYSVCVSIPEGLYPLRNKMSSKYCSLALKLPLPVDSLMKLHYGIVIGLCVPLSCDARIFVQFMSKVSSHFSLQLDEVATFCHTSPSDVKKDAWFWVALVTGLLPLTLAFIATLVECYIWIRWKANLRSTQGREAAVNNDEYIHDENADTPEERLLTDTDEVGSMESRYSYEVYHEDFTGKSWLPIKMLLAFSIPTNVQKLGSSPAQDRAKRHPLSLLNGIRVITMLWIIFGHCILFAVLTGDNTLVYGQESLRLWYFQVIVTATLSVDTFFFMSGLTATYVLIPRTKNLGGCFDYCKFWLRFVLHRFVRLTPVYLFLIILYAGLFHHLYDGPLYPQRPELLDSTFCRRHWWVTYLNNLVYTGEMCMAWSWYLANDFQFSIILAPIFISLLNWKEVVGLLFAFLLILSSILATFGIAYSHGYLPGMLTLASYETIYIKPYTRWGTYAIGLILGWILLARPRENKPDFTVKNAVITTTGLAVATVFTVSTVYGLYGVTWESNPLPTGVAAFYTAMHRPVFILGIAIVVYLSVNGYTDPIEAMLAWSGFQIPSRLTYGVYLIHPLVLLFIILGSQTPPIVDNLYSITLFFAVVPISHIASFVLYLAIEQPFANLEKCLRKREPSHNRQ